MPINSTFADSVWNNPVFPVEIFGRIIDSLVDSGLSDTDSIANRWQLRFGAEPVNPSTLSELKRCALVCRSFLPFCRAHIFYSMHTVGIYTYARKTVTNDGLRSRIQVLKSNPDLCSYIRELHMNVQEPSWEGYDSPTNRRMTQEELKICEEVLNLCPNIIHLSFNNHVYHEALGYPRLFIDMCNHLLHVFLHRGKLACIQLVDVDELDIPLVCRLSPGLKQLSLSRLRKTIPAFSAPTFEVTRLDIMCCRVSFPLSLLKHFPYLTDLHIREVISCTDGESDSRPPSFVLNQLALTFLKKDFLQKFTGFYIREGKAANVLQPFSTLRHLSISINGSTDFDIPSALCVLEQAKHLELLEIKGNKSVLLASLELERLIPSVFPNLAALFLRSTSQDYLTDYLLSLFTSISGQNNLKAMHITFGLMEHSLVVTPRAVGQWNALACILASPSGFPQLEGVTIRLQVRARSIAKNSLRDDVDFASLAASMGQLKARLGTAFVAEVLAL